MKEQSYRFHPLRFKPGEDPYKRIFQFVQSQQIEAGWIATCVGSLTEVPIRFANRPEADTLRGHFEILSLTGTLSMAGMHVHISVSDSTGQTFGGHLVEGAKVYTTVEVVIGESLNHIFTREEDGTTPWKELQIKTK